MKIISLPTVVEALVFDVDMTLYDNKQYYNSQNRLLIKRLAKELGKAEEQMEQEVAAIRIKHNEEGELSLGNTFLQFGISIAQSVRWREELFKPEDYLQYDSELVSTMQILSKHFKLSVVTNNPTVIGKNTLRVLGVDGFFQVIVGLDISGESKPTMTPFNIVADKLGISLKKMVSIGDRMAVDIEIPVKNGMGGILIEHLDDVYKLPNILLRDTVG